MNCKSNMAGFRPFFLGATVFSIASMAVWFAAYHLQFPVGGHFSFIVWHAHEMIYGFVSAIVAGFLLTAVGNWTGLQTVTRCQLLVIFAGWVIARISVYFSFIQIWALAIVDNAWFVGLIYYVSKPIIEKRQWKNLGVIFKLVFFLVGNLYFYALLAEIVDGSVSTSLYSGVYLSVALTIEIADRIIPPFTERGVGYPVKLKRYPKLNLVGLFLFLLFWLVEIAAPHSLAGGILALFLGGIYLFRLVGWYTVGIWKKPLLWILHLGFLFIAVGFLLIFLSALSVVSFFLALHCLAFGGVGLIIAGMIARVSWAHSGKDIHSPPKQLWWIFLLLSCGAVIRIFVPMIAPSHYPLWIALSQMIWVASYGMLLWVYLPLWLGEKNI